MKQLTTTEMKTYNKSILEYNDVRSAVNYAKEEALREGLEKGLEKGIKKGRMKGLNEGLKRGREELKESRRATVLACFKKGLSVEDISEITGLSKESILQLKLES